MALPVLATKLYIPSPRTELVPRPGLIERLNKGLTRKLTLISAPAGFGKTTLVAEWLSNSRLDSGDPGLDSKEKQEIQNPPVPGTGAKSKIKNQKAAWFSVDEADNDPIRFLTYIVAAMQKIDGSVGQDLLQSSQLPPLESLMTILINEATSALEHLPSDQKFVLVLDDYHLIQNSLLHELLEFLLEHQPPQMHLTIITRQDPPLSLSRLRVRGQVTEIRQHDLRFTLKEAVTFFNQSMGLKLTVELVEALESRTEGWIAGLQLAALSLQGRAPNDVTAFIEAFSGSHRYVIDYLVEEVIQQQPEDIRQFLSQTAVLDRLTAPLCNAVTGRSDSQDILTQLEQANLFLIPLDEHRVWYRYHHLFAEFLRTEMDIPEQATLHQKAACWFERNGSLGEAIRHALAAADMAETGRLIKSAADGLLHRGELTTLLGWLEALPEAFVRADYELATYAGWLLLLIGRGQEAEAFVESAETSLPPDASSTSRGRLMGLRACLVLVRDEAGVQLAREALALLEEADTFYRGVILLILGEGQNLRGDVAGAAQTFREALHLGQRHNDQLMTLAAMVNLAQQLNWQGKRREARALCQKAIDQFDDAEGKSWPMVGLAYIALGEIEYYANNLEQALELIGRGVELGKQQALMGFVISGKMALALLHEAMGNPEVAVTASQEVHQMALRANFDAYVPLTEALEAYFQLRLGNVAAVEQWAEQADFSPADTPSPIREFEYLVYARLLLAQGNYDEAWTVLVNLEDAARKGGRYLLLMMITILQARVQVALGDDKKALTALEKTLRLAEPEGYLRIFLNESPTIAPLLPSLRPLAPAFVGRLLAAVQQESDDVTEPAQAVSPPPSSPSDSQPLVEPLSDRELEVLQMIASGRSNRETAQELYVTVGTVKKHLSNIFGKLEVGSRTQAVARARDLGLIS